MKCYLLEPVWLHSKFNTLYKGNGFLVYIVKSSVVKEERLVTQTCVDVNMCLLL